MASNSTVVIKKKGARGGLNPGTAGTGAGRLPVNAITGGQSGADPVQIRANSQKKNRRVIGYGEH